MGKVPLSVLISYYQASKYGGFYKYVQELTKNLVKYGIRVHLIVKNELKLSPLETSPNICFHYIPTGRKVLFALHSIFKIIKVTLKCKIDIFHSHGVDEGAFNSILKSIFRRKQVVSLRVNWWTWLQIRKDNSKFLKRILYSLYLFISPILIRRADGLMVSNTRLKKIVSKISKEKPLLLKQNTVDVVQFDPSQISSGLKRVFTSSGPIIMYIGRLLPYKGVEYLIEAVNYVKMNHPDIVLILIGDGHYKSFLEKLVEQKNLQKTVQFVGYQRNIAEWLTIADIFILPSLTEGSSNALLEAMSMSRPVIATRVGNAPDIIKHLDNGILVEPKNAKKIARYINVLLENKELANIIGMNARDTVIKNFSHFTVSDIIDLYNELFGVVSKQ